MMPTSENHQDETVDYKKKYRALKRKVKILLCENECFVEELRKAQRKLLRVARDKNFLLDRLLQHEPIEDTSDDSEATQTSDSETESAQKDGQIQKKKKLSMSPASSMDTSRLLGGTSATSLLALKSQSPSLTEPPKKKAKIAKKSPKAGQSKPNKGLQSSTPLQVLPGMSQMSREELERHLELKQSTKPQFMSIERAPNSLPDDIFSNENSNQDGDISSLLVKEEEEDDSDLIIDMPQD